MVNILDINRLPALVFQLQHETLQSLETNCVIAGHKSDFDLF